MARDGGVRADGRVCERRRVEGRIRGVGQRARAQVVGWELECERGVTEIGRRADLVQSGSSSFRAPVVEGYVRIYGHGIGALTSRHL